MDKTPNIFLMILFVIILPSIGISLGVFNFLSENDELNSFEKTMISLIGVYIGFFSIDFFMYISFIIEKYVKKI